MKTIVGFISLLFMFSSCKKEYTLEKIDSTILVSAEVKDSEIFIKSETEKLYNFAYSITYALKIKKNEIHIHYKKVKIGDLALTVVQAAKVTINLGSLKKDSYNVFFKLNNKKMKGTLTVGDSTTLKMITSGNVRLK
jgi:hypothetical protein